MVVAQRLTNSVGIQRACQQQAIGGTQWHANNGQARHASIEACGGRQKSLPEPWTVFVSISAARRRASLPSKVSGTALWQSSKSSCGACVIPRRCRRGQPVFCQRFDEGRGGITCLIFITMLQDEEREARSPQRGKPPGQLPSIT